MPDYCINSHYSLNCIRTNFYTAMKSFRFSILIIFLILVVQELSAQTVYVTNTGEKYHRSGCRYLSRSSIPIDLSRAKASGYTPCSVCKPTTVITSSGNNGTQPVQKTDSTKVEQKSVQPSNSQNTSRQCSATTQAGTRCKRMTTNPNGKCWQHQ